MVLFVAATNGAYTRVQHPRGGIALLMLFFFVFDASSNSDILFGFSWNSTFVSVLDMCIFGCYYYRKRIVIVQEHNNSVWGEFQAWAVAFSRFFPLVIGSSWGYDSKYLIIIINYL